MTYGKVSFEERIKENIRSYHSVDLYDMQVVEWQMKSLCEKYGLELMLTDRHGERAVVLGDFNREIDVAKEPGLRIMIYNHTTGHLYVQAVSGSEVGKDAEEELALLVQLLQHWGEKAYLARELEEYKEELEEKLEAGRRSLKGDDRKDLLTGTLSKTYFENRLKVIDRSEVAPVALIQANINDWKFFHDNFGEEESDRLIHIVGKTLMDMGKPEYVIGRCDGDLFNIVIPMPEEQEAEEYVSRLRGTFETFEDSVLVPSVAFGIVYKTNVEESLLDKLSDAEYEMFNNKLEIKSAPGYRERLEKGKNK